MTAPIDWTRPIELDTVPPRPARVVGGPKLTTGSFEVSALWLPEFEKEAVMWVAPEGCVRGMVGMPRVRNVTTPTDDVTAELLAALKAVNKSATPTADMRGVIISCGAFDDVLRAIAKAEAR